MKMGLQSVTPLWFAATRMFLGALAVTVGDLKQLKFR